MRYRIAYDQPGRLRVRFGPDAFTQEQGYGIAALLLGRGALGGGELPLEPVQGAAAPHRAPLEKPQALHHVGAENQPGVGLGAVHAEAHAPCLAALLLGLPRMDDSGS